MSLKQKTLNGLSWSFVDNFANQGISFLVIVVLSNLIDPAEFGVLGMITFFMAISITFIDSGFGSALIRKKDCTSSDYSTVFYFNMAIAVCLYALLFISSPYIAVFFNEPRLASILRVAGLVLIFNGASTIQLTLLAKNIDFKTKAKISASADILAGIIAIIMAYKGFGVWSLVWRSVLGPMFTAFFVWISGKWRPSLVFSVKSFKELFGFSYKLLLSTLLDTIFKYIYYPIIGKFFSPTTLGYFTQAERYSNLFSSTLTTNIQRVSYPALASIQDDPVKLKSAYRKLIKSTMIITFSLMLGLAAVVKPLFLILIGEKWLPAVPYLQLMCLSAMFYPLHAINLNAIIVKGRSDLFLKLEIIKKTITVPLVIVGIYWGVEALLIGGIVISVFSYFLNSYYSGRLINYSSWAQLADILPLLLVAGSVSLLAWGITFLQWNNWITIFLQVITGVVLTIGTYECLKHPDYKDLKQIVIQTLNKVIPGKS